MLLGIFIGLVLGLAIALGVAWYLSKGPSPFASNAEKPAEAPAPKSAPAAPAEEGGKAPAQEAKPRFDFYKILPGTETPPPAQPAPAPQPPAPEQPQKPAYYLQAGAFQQAAQADNLKAKLALLGLEASVQTTTLPDKGVVHRVWLGPYASADDANQAREQLKQNGIETTLISTPEKR